MSVLLRFHAVTDKDIEDILEEPVKLEILYYGEILNTDSLEGIEEDIIESILKWTPTINSDILYVEGMFQSLHYLLTTEFETNLGTFPLNFLNGNRIEVGEIGWGPVTFYNSDDVKVIAKSLSEINFTELEKRYDANIFNQKEIYPRGYKWKTTDITSLLEKVTEIQQFFNEMKNKNLGLYRVFI